MASPTLSIEALRRGSPRDPSPGLLLIALSRKLAAALILLAPIGVAAQALPLETDANTPVGIIKAIALVKALELRADVAPGRPHLVLCSRVFPADATTGAALRNLLKSVSASFELDPTCDRQGSTMDTLWHGVVPVIYVDSIPVNSKTATVYAIASNYVASWHEMMTVVRRRYLAAATITITGVTIQ